MTPEQTAALAAKCAEFDPALDDWEIAAALNEPNLQGARLDTDPQKVWGVLVLDGASVGIQDAMATTGNTQAEKDKRARAYFFNDAMTLPVIQTSDDAVYTKAVEVVDGLLADGLITAATKTRILALVKHAQVSWAQVNLGAAVTAADVAAARGKPRIVDESLLTPPAEGNVIEGGA